MLPVCPGRKVCHEDWTCSSVDCCRRRGFTHESDLCLESLIFMKCHISQRVLWGSQLNVDGGEWQEAGHDHLRHCVAVPRQLRNLAGVPASGAEHSSGAAVSLRAPKQCALHAAPTLMPPLLTGQTQPLPSCSVGICSAWGSHCTTEHAAGWQATRAEYMLPRHAAALAAMLNGLESPF